MRQPHFAGRQRLRALKHKAMKLSDKPGLTALLEKMEPILHADLDDLEIAAPGHIRIDLGAGHATLLRDNDTEEVIGLTVFKDDSSKHFVIWFRDPVTIDASGDNVRIDLG